MTARENRRFAREVHRFMRAYLAEQRQAQTSRIATTLTRLEQGAK